MRRSNPKLLFDMDCHVGLRPPRNDERHKKGGPMTEDLSHRWGLRPSSFTQLPEIKFRSKKLSDKQILILELIALGYENKDIASQLLLSVRTVEAHIYALRKILAQRTGTKINDRELVLFAVEMIIGFTNHIQNKLENDLKKSQDQNQVVIIDDWEDEEVYKEFATEEILSANKIGNFCLV